MVNNKHPNPEDENKKAPDDDDTSSWGHSTGSPIARPTVHTPMSTTLGKQGAW